MMDEGQPGSKAPRPMRFPASFHHLHHLFCPDESFDEDSFDEEAYYEALGTRPALNMEELDQSYQQMIDLFSVCTSEDPKKRPSAACIVEALEANLSQK